MCEAAPDGRVVQHDDFNIKVEETLKVHHAKHTVKMDMGGEPARDINVG